MRITGIGVFLWLSTFVYAQQSKWFQFAVFFDKKDTTYYSINTPQQYLSTKAIANRAKFGVAINHTDLPVSPDYLKQFTLAGYQIHNSSKWLNCAIINTPDKNAAKVLSKFSGVVDVKLVGYLKSNYSNEQNELFNEYLPINLKKKYADFYGVSAFQTTQLGINKLHESGLTANDVTIAVIDAGFYKANQMEAFSYTLKNVIATYDFVDNEANVFDDDDHGTAVWSCLAANYKYNIVGTAPHANYLLLRSENAPTEYPVEEFYWAFAAEFADSIGAQIISSSLGYNTFDNNQMSYEVSDIKKGESWISKAAAIAVNKGILVVCSSGNEGDNDWKHIVFPAEQEGVITVGGVDKDGLLASFSSIGISGLQSIKPDVVALSKEVSIIARNGMVYEGNGTSYACPIVAGAIACLLPAVQSNKQLKHVMQLCADNYFAPNLLYGYGVPNFWLAYKLLTVKTDSIIQVQKMSDNFLHVAGYTTTLSAISISIVDAQQNQVYTQVINPNEKGMFRVKLPQSKLIQSGTYNLTYSINNIIKSVPFNIN